MKFTSTQSYRIGFLTRLRHRFSQDSWTLCTLTAGYYIGLCVFVVSLLLMGGCALKDGGYADIGVKTTITPAPVPRGAPSTEPLQKVPPVAQ